MPVGCGSDERSFCGQNGYAMSTLFVRPFTALDILFDPPQIGPPSTSTLSQPNDQPPMMFREDPRMRRTPSRRQPRNDNPEQERSPPRRPEDSHNMDPWVGLNLERGVLSMCMETSCQGFCERYVRVLTFPQSVFHILRLTDLPYRYATDHCITKFYCCRLRLELRLVWP